MGAGVKPESLSERAKRLAAGQGDGSLAGRAQRLAEQQRSVPRESLRLDVRPAAESSGALPHNRANRETNFGGFSEGTAEFAAALPLVAAQAIPGMEAFEAAAGSVGSQFTKHPMGFRESRDALRSQTDPIPAPIKLAVQAPAMAKAAASMALSPVKAGAVIGAADQALSADDMSIAERAGRTAVGAGAGAALGKVFDTGAVGTRAMVAKDLGKNAVARKEAMELADKAAYGASRQEAVRAGGTSPEIKRALKHATVAPFAKAVRASETFKGADDATVLEETFKLMSETQRRLGRTMVNADDFRAGSFIQKSDIDIGKKELLKAADGIMPSFRSAVEQHAKMAGESEALGQGAAVARRLVMKNKGNPAKLAKQSPEAFSKRIKSMSPEQRKAAVEGLLAELKTKIGVQPNMISLWGGATTAIRPARVSAMLRELGGKDQAVVDAILRAALLTGTQATP